MLAALSKARAERLARLATACTAVTASFSALRTASTARIAHVVAAFSKPLARLANPRAQTRGHWLFSVLLGALPGPTAASSRAKEDRNKSWVEWEINYSW